MFSFRIFFIFFTIIYLTKSDITIVKKKPLKWHNLIIWRWWFGFSFTIIKENKELQQSHAVKHILELTT